MKTKRPAGLIAIVAYKSFVASLLAVTAVALLFALKNYDGLEDFAGSYLLESKHETIDWFLDKVLRLTPRTLVFSGVGAGVYSIVTGIEAVGLWYQKTWAKILVVILVGTSVPLEIYELVKGFSPLKLGIFIINLAVLAYLISDFRNEFRSHKQQ